MSDFNRDTLPRAIREPLVEEACLREHQYYAGRYWDLKVMALYRERLSCV